jgi:hypothetical protein
MRGWLVIEDKPNYFLEVYECKMIKRFENVLQWVPTLFRKKFREF